MPTVHSLLRTWAAMPAPTKPCLLWRETLPQHFASADGTFPRANLSASETRDGIRSARCRAAAAQCAPLRAEAVFGPGGQKFNEAVNGVLERARIPLLRVYRRATACWGLHTDCAADVELPDHFPRAADCTHWPFPSPVIEYVTRAMLQGAHAHCGLR